MPEISSPSVHPSGAPPRPSVGDPAGPGGSHDIRTLLGDLLARLGPEVVFGEVVRQGATAVIPVSEFRVGFGFGSGRGQGSTHRASPGGGGGGGAGGRVIPRGFIRLSPEGARFVPLTDPTRIALTALAVFAVTVAVSLRLRP